MLKSNRVKHACGDSENSTHAGTIILPLILVIVMLWSPEHSAADERPPNIVLLLADDLGWTGLGCFGSDLYETPHLDALADRGIKFTNAYSACTVCSPTRASILTGKSPARLHLTDFIAGQNRPYAKWRIPDWTKRLKPDQVTIAERLRDVGYRTGHIGKWHLSGIGEQAAGTQAIDQGFDVSFERPTGSKGYLLKPKSGGDSKPVYLTDRLTDKACEFIADSKAEPFFLYFAYNVPHTPIQGRADLVRYFADKVDDTATHRNPVYAAMVASLDQSVGRIVATLEGQGLSDNTAVIFISDNGGLTQRNGKHDGFTENLPLRRGKGSAYEGGVRVPAIVHYPGVTSAGTVSDEPIITTDLFPTICELAGLDHRPDSSAVLDGESLIPIWKNAGHTMDRDLFWHYPHYHAGGDGPYSAVRSGQFKLIQFYEDDRWELYDLSVDLGERTDVSTKLTQVTQTLQGKLRRWLQSVDAQLPVANDNYDAERETQVVRRSRK